MKSSTIAKKIDACRHPKHTSTFSTDDNDFYSKPAVAEVGSPDSKEHATQRPGILNGTTAKFLNGKENTAQINSEKNAAKIFDTAVTCFGETAVTDEDLKALEPQRWLNSTIVNSRFELLSSEHVLFFNPWFFTVMLSKRNDRTTNFEHLERWTQIKIRKVSKIQIPVNSEVHKHCGLIHADKSAATVNFYDSISTLNAFAHATSNSF